MELTEQTMQRPNTAHVTVAPQVNRASNAPEISAPGRTVPSQSSQKPPQASAPHINWGAVLKGALIVTAVVAVAVVGAGFVSGVVLPAIMETTIGAGLVNGAVASADIAAGVAEVSWSAGVNALTGLAEGLGITSVFSASPGFVTAWSGAAASWIGGLGAAVVALPLALKQFAMIQFMDPGVIHAATGNDMVAANALAAKKTAIVNQHAEQHFHAPQGHADAADPILADPTDSMVDESTVQTSTKAIKVVHHAAEDHHHYQQHRAAREVLARSAAANRSWADRAIASQPAKLQPVASRKDSSFTENLQADAARLDAQPDTRSV